MGSEGGEARGKGGDQHCSFQPCAFVCFIRACAQSQLSTRPSAEM